MGIQNCVFVKMSNGHADILCCDVSHTVNTNQLPISHCPITAFHSSHRRYKVLNYSGITQKRKMHPLLVNQLSPGSTTGHMPNSSGPAYSTICFEKNQTNHTGWLVKITPINFSEEVYIFGVQEACLHSRPHHTKLACCCILFFHLYTNLWSSPVGHFLVLVMFIQQNPICTRENIKLLTSKLKEAKSLNRCLFAHIYNVHIWTPDK